MNGDVLTTRERYDAMIKTMIGIELRELGSRKRRNTFYRTSDAGWTLIDFQASQFGTRDDVSFTINLGISFIELQPRGQAPPGADHVKLLRSDHGNSPPSMR